MSIWPKTVRWSGIVCWTSYHWLSVPQLVRQLLKNSEEHTQSLRSPLLHSELFDAMLKDLLTITVQPVN